MKSIVPHFPCTIRMGPRKHEVFSELAAENMIGQVFRFVDRDVKVTDARLLNSGDIDMTLEEYKSDSLKDEFKELLVGRHLMMENEYEEFYKAVSDSQPQYDWDPIFKVVAKIIKSRIDELY